MAMQIFKLFNILRVDSDHNFCGSVLPEMDPKKFKSLGNVSNSKSKVSDFLKRHKNVFTAFPTRIVSVYVSETRLRISGKFFRSFR